MTGNINNIFYLSSGQNRSRETQKSKLELLIKRDKIGFKTVDRALYERILPKTGLSREVGRYQKITLMLTPEQVRHYFLGADNVLAQICSAIDRKTECQTTRAEIDFSFAFLKHFAAHPAVFSPRINFLIETLALPDRIELDIYFDEFGQARFLRLPESEWIFSGFGVQEREPGRVVKRDKDCLIYSYFSLEKERPAIEMLRKIPKESIITVTSINKTSDGKAYLAVCLFLSFTIKNGLRGFTFLGPLSRDEIINYSLPVQGLINLGGDIPVISPASIRDRFGRHKITPEGTSGRAIKTGVELNSEQIEFFAGILGESVDRSIILRQTAKYLFQEAGKYLP